jgi:uncharacterized protein YbcI
MEREEGASVGQVRRQIDDAFRQVIFDLVNHRMGVEAKSVLLDTSLESGTTSSIVVLVSLPQVRNAARIPKTNAYRQTSNNDDGDSRYSFS